MFLQECFPRKKNLVFGHVRVREVGQSHFQTAEELHDIILCVLGLNLVGGPAYPLSKLAVKREKKSETNTLESCYVRM